MVFAPIRPVRTNAAWLLSPQVHEAESRRIRFRCGLQAGADFGVVDPAFGSERVLRVLKVTSASGEVVSHLLGQHEERENGLEYRLFSILVRDVIVAAAPSCQSHCNHHSQCQPTAEPIAGR